MPDKKRLRGEAIVDRSGAPKAVARKDRAERKRKNNIRRAVHSNHRTAQQQQQQLSPPKPTVWVASGTPSSPYSLEQDVLNNAKVLMYPTNAVNALVVRNHQQVVMENLLTKPPTRRTVTTTTGEEPNYIRAAWAESTTSARRALWARFVQFRRVRGPVESLDASAVMFIREIPNINLSSRKTYANTLAATLRELMIPCPTLRLMARGMVHMGANIATTTAIPILRSEVNQLVEQFRPASPLLALTFWLMWKTASRFDDVSGLTRENFLVVSEEEIILQFGVLKANQSGVPSATSLVHIKDRQAMDWQCATLTQLAPSDKICSLSYTTFMERIKAVHPNLSAHSFKHGAHDTLLDEVEKGLLPLSVIPLILKHKDPTVEYPEQSIRYAKDKAKYARILGTGSATFLL